MYKISLVLAIAVVGGCSGESPEANERAEQVQADTGAATAAANPHTGHVMGDTASGVTNVTDAMAGMDHESAAPAGPAAHARNVGAHGGADGAADGQHSGVATGDAAASAGEIDHSRHAAATPSPEGQSAAQSHAIMGHVQPAATSGRGSVPADHSQHAQVAVPAGQSPTPGTEHSQHAAGSSGANAARTPAPAHQGMDHSRATPDPHVGHAQAQGTAPATAGAAPGMDKLMTLVAELVQDSVVQRRIEQDSILRGQWEDPGVRQIILRR